MNLDLQQIAQAVAGNLVPTAARGGVSGVSTDTRTLQPGQLYVPLRGENFDGHDFLPQAVAAGAAACFSEIPQPGLGLPLIEVGDTLFALGELAAAWRRQFLLPLVAVTGSSGKTTTKEMLGAILAQTGPGLKTAGNFNNRIGLPLTLFGLTAEHRWAVLEMGMSERGEIARLAAIAEPTIGLVTNIGPAHLETLRSLDGVARAKGELFAALPPGGTALVNVDDPRVAELPVANGVRRVLYGCSPGAEIRAEGVRVEGDALCFRLVLPGSEHVVRLTLAGRHNVVNALAAAAAATVLAVAPALIVRGLETFRPAKGRLEPVRLPGDLLLLEDTYNANPLSVKAALHSLAESVGTGRRIAVLGDMLELGEWTQVLHREVGAAAAAHADLLLVLGEQAVHLAAGAREAGMAGDQVLVAESATAAVAVLRTWLQAGDRILIKGSRGMKMERIAAALRAGDVPATADH